ncbi:hypothetical protein MIAR_12570 [Microbacterium arabinogalactanolyticum]|nr:hypothetical protein MIAR_12570 [Microbacterium arabinogalactanolyticum]
MYPVGASLRESVSTHMSGAYSPKMSKNKDSKHTPPSEWDAARGEHWHGARPTSETSIRDARSRAEKPDPIPSHRPRT